MDGVDAAILQTDGRRVLGQGPTLHLSYDDTLREVIRRAQNAAKLWPAQAKTPRAIGEAERAITSAHVAAVTRLMERSEFEPHDIDFLGFHGQTILHDPDSRRSIQLGDAQALASETGVDTIADFRSADMAAGGQGAPLTCLYHQALVQSTGLDEPTAVVNIGGVANVTFVEGDNLVAFDTGPGNALIDDWVRESTGQPYDEFGALASVGKIHDKVLDFLMTLPYFDKPPPKSMDRNELSSEPLATMNIEDGAATLTALTAEVIAKSAKHYSAPPLTWVICGGGRHNATLMMELENRIQGTVLTAEELGWRGDDLEAEAFAFLAVRSFLGLPLSLPTTTGVPRPTTGGTLFRAT